MEKHKNSVLAIIKKGSDPFPDLEIYDSYNNIQKNISSEDLSDIEKINNVLLNFKDDSDITLGALADFRNWQDKGWGKSLAYQMSSKAKLPQKNKLTEANKKSVVLTAENKVYSIPESLLKRRTKRIFETTSLENKIFNNGLNEFFAANPRILDGMIIHFIIFNVDNIEPGVYQLDKESVSLNLVQLGQFAVQMSDYTQGMRTHKSAAFSVIITAKFDELQKIMPYSRGLRNAYVESGRLAQRLIISYMQYGVYSLVTPALCDRLVLNLLKLPEPAFSPLYSLTLGYPLR
jgi:hypothetical protein